MATSWPRTTSDQANIPNAPAVNSSDTSTIRQSMNGDTSAAPARRGLRSITPGSGGSKASARPRVTVSTMLIHRICTAVIGKVMPSSKATTIASASPPLVGRVQATTLRMLS